MELGNLFSYRTFTKRLVHDCNYFYTIVNFKVKVLNHPIFFNFIGNNEITETQYLVFQFSSVYNTSFYYLILY